MTARPGRTRLVALLPGQLASLLVAGVAQAACLTLASHPEAVTLARIAVAADDPAFTVTHVHSVTRTPVEEWYRIDGAAIVQTEIRFEQHGPGLPTESDAPGRWMRRDGRYVVPMSRRFERIAMRVHADQRPALATTARGIDLAQWGDRAISLVATADHCGPP